MKDELRVTVVATGLAWLPNPVSQPKRPDPIRAQPQQAEPQNPPTQAQP